MAIPTEFFLFLVLRCIRLSEFFLAIPMILRRILPALSAPFLIVLFFLTALPFGVRAADDFTSASGGLLPFPVDAKGVPLSHDPLWNACIRRHPVLDHDGIPYSCWRYHKGSSWKQPDLKIIFTWSDSIGHYLELPAGYAATVTDPVKEFFMKMQ
jgi:hypothetical protein